MNIRDLVAQYVSFRRTLGERFSTNESILRSFCRTLGGQTDIRAVRSKSVRAFLAGSGPVTSFWHRKYITLRGFYRYALNRGYVTSIPLPTVIPKLPPRLVPYIYSHEELRRLLAATTPCQGPNCLIEPVTLRMILLLLYGAGLRASEALALNVADVNLTEALLTVRLSKFFKSRLVPLGASLTRALQVYADWKTASHPPIDSGTPFFVGRNGSRLSLKHLDHTYDRLRTTAGVRRTDGGRYQPRLHDLRHSFAVHRLITWYRQGADVQQLLPQLSVYLGHAYLASTQVYLTMTSELLREACTRFEQYARKENWDD